MSCWDFCQSFPRLRFPGLSETSYWGPSSRLAGRGTDRASVLREFTSITARRATAVWRSHEPHGLPLPRVFTRMKSCPRPSQPRSPLHSDAGNPGEGGSYTWFTHPAPQEKAPFPSTYKRPEGKEMHSGELGQLLVLDGTSQVQRVSPG